MSDAESSGCERANDGELSPQEVARLLRDQPQDFVLIDCRTPDEWEFGHIHGARHFPLQELSLRLADLREFEDELIVVMCRSGKRSCTMATVLRAEGFSNVKFMSGGLIRWVKDVDSSLTV